MRTNSKYGFIGAGNMAGALIRGAIKSTLIPANRIEAYDNDEKKLEELKSELSIDVTTNILRLITNCDCIILAVKPNIIESVLNQIASAVSIKKPLIVSIAAGKSISTLENIIGSEIPILRVMSNLNAAVGEAISAFCFNKYVTEEMKKSAVVLLRSCGEAVELPENLFPVFDAVGGAAPAFCFMFADALIRAAVKNGMTRDTAEGIVYKTFEGSAKYLINSKKHPWELIDKVCSPGGITIEGVTSLQENGFQDAVTKAVDAVIEKDLTL